MSKPIKARWAYSNQVVVMTSVGLPIGSVQRVVIGGRDVWFRVTGGQSLGDGEILHYGDKVPALKRTSKAEP